MRVPFWSHYRDCIERIKSDKRMSRECRYHYGINRPLYITVLHVPATAASSARSLLIALQGFKRRKKLHKLIMRRERLAAGS